MCVCVCLCIVPVAAEQQVAELAEEDAPDSDDVPFLDLVEFVVKKICNPGNKFSKKNLYIVTL
jgi:hypothetical protein